MEISLSQVTLQELEEQLEIQNKQMELTKQQLVFLEGTIQILLALINKIKNKEV